MSTTVHEGVAARGEAVPVRLRRALPAVVAGGTLFGVVVWLAWRTGGYFAPDMLAAAVVVFVVLAVLLAVHVPQHGFSDHALVGLGSLAGLAAWTGLSAGWSPDPDAALHGMQRGLLYAGLFGLGLLAAGSGRYARRIVWVALAAALVVAGAGVLSRLAPGLFAGATPDIAIDDYRLGYPLGYWNAFGGLAAFGGVLALGLSADPRSAIPLRAVAAGAAVVFVVAVDLSVSRGAVLAAIAGLAVLVALSAHRGSLLLSVLIVGAAGTLAVLRLHTYPALVEDPILGDGQAAEGRAALAQLVPLVAAAVAATAVVARARTSAQVMRLLRRGARPAALALAAVLLVLAFGGYVVGADPIERRTTAAIDDGTSWVSRQWRDFLRPASFSASGSSRLTSARGTRSDLYRVAIDDFERSPVRGEGAGAFGVSWMRERRVGEKVANAHSLPLETAGELGLVGALLLLAFAGSLAAAAVRSRLRPTALPRAQAAAIGGACAVWVVHASVDWDWQVPAFTGLVLALGATLYPVGRRRRSAATGDLARWYGPRHSERRLTDRDAR